MNLRFGLRYLICLLPGWLAISGLLVDYRLHAVNIFWNIGVLVLADWLLAPRRNSQRSNVSSVIPDIILYIASALHLTAIVLLVVQTGSGALAGGVLWLSVLSVGLNAGISGIVVAHELIHRRLLTERLLGQLNLLLVNYAHFYVEHVRGHHRRVGTPDDPATARYGESLYAFQVRTVPGQWHSAVRLEADRIAKAGKGARFGLRNFVVRALLVQVLVGVAIGFGLGALALAAWLAQSVVGIFLLEYVNYIEHYGLTRTEGRKVDVHHSWQSDAPSSRFSLIELSRHSDHHLRAAKPYHLLESHPESPELNSGYFGMFFIALIPPLWFKLVHRRMAEAGLL